MRKFFTVSALSLLVFSAVSMPVGAITSDSGIQSGLGNEQGSLGNEDVVGVIDNFVNVRSGAGLGFSVLGTVSVGDAGIVIGGPLSNNGYA